MIIKMDKKIEIIESGKINSGVDLILGIPDVGLVGTIAATHIIDELGLVELGHMDSKLFPPLTIVHEHTPKSPLRFYGNDKIVVLISEMPVAPSLIYPLTEALVDWFAEKQFRRVISVGGIARQDRMEIEVPEVYALPSNQELAELLVKEGIKVFEEGLLVGSYGAILKGCVKKGVNAVYLMAESHLNYPDPGAAASALEAINKIAGLRIDVKSLKEKGEEIRIKAKDLMKRTDSAMREMQKTQEQEIPMMYR